MKKGFFVVLASVLLSGLTAFAVVKTVKHEPSSDVVQTQTAYDSN